MVEDRLELRLGERALQVALFREITIIILRFLIAEAEILRMKVAHITTEVACFTRIDLQHDGVFALVLNLPREIRKVRE